MKKIFFLVVTFQLNVLFVLPVFYEQIILQVWSVLQFTAFFYVSSFSIAQQKIYLNF